MAKKKSNKLKDALKNLDEMPDSFFGNESLNLNDLPCVKAKGQKVKKTYMYKRSVIEKIERMAKKHQVAVGDLISDILDRVN